MSLVKPLKENATDEEKAAHQEKVAANTSKANRILVLVRHGQYNLQVGTSDRHYACMLNGWDVRLLRLNGLYSKDLTMSRRFVASSSMYPGSC